MKITKKKIEARGLYTYDCSFINDWKYYDEDGYAHIIRKGIDIIGNIKTRAVVSHRNDDYAYKDQKKNWHLIRDGIDLLDGKEAKCCNSYDNKDYDFRDPDQVWHKYNYKNQEIKRWIL